MYWLWCPRPDLLIKQGAQEIEWSRTLRSWWRGRRNLRHAVATTAGQLMMTRSAITVAATATVARAARVLTEHHIKRLPVVDADGKLVSIVNRKDLLTVFLRKNEDIRDDIVERVFEHGLGIPVDPATVTVDVHGGEITLTGQLDLMSQLSLIEAMTRTAS